MIATSPMFITFAIYVIGMIAIGFMAYRATHNLDDYILGGRSLGSLITALSAGASDMSGWLLMGLPGAVFLSGISASWIAIGLILGAYLNWKYVAARLRVHTELNHNALTLPDYFTHRFEDKSKLLRVLSAVVILIFFTIYCASGIVAGARLFELTFQLDYETALWAGALATIIYTFVGGFLAVSWTDAVQASLMIFALLIAPVMTIIAVGGLDTALTTITTKNPLHIDMIRDLDTVAILSLLGWGLGYFGQPHILARFMAASSHKTIPNARRIGMTWMIACLGGAVAVGFFGIAYFEKYPELAGKVIENNERIFMDLAILLFNPWIAGILLSAILAAVMSTLSCQLLVCAGALTEDLYRPFLRKKAGPSELVWVSRLMVLLVALIAILLAMHPDSRVLGLVSYAWAGFGAAFGPVVLISLLWPRMTRNGALLGMLVGAIVVIFWKQYAWLGLYEIIPGFILASLTIIIVSLLDETPSATIQKRFQEANTHYQTD